ncbi:hypothetical protein OXYTRIMIC_270 [Oxytricha trifallax]|uniref:USP domain-containing protein n=1 Tax=Oxytricha trifallax TaxID=1172189 RepID=A0A073IB38_9SPIT|nr:hypothetical protein OXYTRIMIC_270 [Oxytricha trifallax]
MLETYINMGKNWIDHKKRLEDNKVVDKLLAKLDEKIQCYDEDKIQDIYNRLKDVDLNIIIESGYQRLFKTDQEQNQNQKQEEEKKEPELITKIENLSKKRQQPENVFMKEEFSDDSGPKDDSPYDSNKSDYESQYSGPRDDTPVESDEDEVMSQSDSNIESSESDDDAKHLNKLLKDLQKHIQQSPQQPQPKPQPVVKVNPFLVNYPVQQPNPFQAAMNQQVFPFIRWYNNSCLHDSLMHIFYFGIYNKNQEIKSNQVDQCLRPLVQSCRELDRINKNRQYPASNDFYALCERQIRAVQPLRRQIGGRFCNFDDIQNYFKQSSHFKVGINKRSWCSHLHCQYDVTNYEELASIELQELVNNDISQSVIGSLQETDLICDQCNQQTMTREKTIVLAPEFLIVNSVMAEPVQITVNNNIQLDLFDGTQAVYEISGIIYFACRSGPMSIADHFTSILRDGVHNDGEQMNGWWFYNGKLTNNPRNMHKAFDNSNNLNIGPNPPRHTLIPQIIFYNRIQ